MWRESRAFGCHMLWWGMALFFTTEWCSVVLVDSFQPVHWNDGFSNSLCKPYTRQSTALFAGTKKKKKRSSGSSDTKNSSGFGGAAMESCPCGSGETYASCCGKLHRDVNTYRMATPEQVVRARYSAYAKKQPEFLMASTHPLNKNFDTDLKRWKNSIKENMYDNFDMPKCCIVQESLGPDDNEATVQFIAEMILRETGEVTSFMETSTFERAKTHGAWLYKDGVIEAAPGSETLDGSASDADSSDGKSPSMEEK
ncbi:SEC-C motif-containing protein [Nitzschia inconspicua]|uniref:SEC-C motif-containing protein n=1 Tax=Nitzschia inconspicua TaxID=303405 RepID=A0A9K3L0F2_9STRA|nr:SEC-C motif-containing protein [Nitzschia inconspicua]